MKLLIVFNAAGLILFWTMFCFTHTVSVAFLCGGMCAHHVNELLMLSAAWNAERNKQ